MWRDFHVPLQAQLLRPFLVGVGQGDPAARAGGHDGLDAPPVYRLDVAPYRLLEDVPLAAHQEGHAAAGLLLAQVVEVDAAFREDAHRAAGDVLLHVGGGAAGPVSQLAPFLQVDVFRQPGVAVPREAGPDVVLHVVGRAHHLEGREGVELARGHQLAPHLGPQGLDGQVGLADRVALLAGGAEQEVVGHLLGQGQLALAVPLQEVPLAAGRGLSPSPCRNRGSISPRSSRTGRRCRRRPPAPWAACPSCAGAAWAAGPPACRRCRRRAAPSASSGR